MLFTLTTIVLLSAAALFPLQLRAQVSFHTTLLGNVLYTQGASDVWGYVDPNTGTEYALIGLRNGVAVIDVSADPANPVEVAFISGPLSVWRDIKVHSNYAYVINETGGGLQIIDLSDPTNAYEAATYTAQFQTAHNLYIDAGYAYIIGMNAYSGGIVILGLDDPLAPTYEGAWNNTYLHDLYVRDNVAYAPAIYEGGSIYILDVFDKQSITTLAHFNYADGFSHNTWTSDDGNTLYTTDERTNGAIRAWDITDLSDISALSAYRALENTIPHNIHIREPWGFISYYVNGLRVLDLTDPARPIEVAYYDTYAGSNNAGYEGDWGTYPYAPSGNIYISDINTGFYLVSFDSTMGGGIGGTVTDDISGLPLPGAEIHFVEANKFVTSSDSGTYAFYSAAGEHSSVVSAPGYWDSDTLTMEILPGDTTVNYDISLTPNLAQIAFSADSIIVFLDLGDSTTESFDITNVGSGPLSFFIRDLNGPAPSNQGKRGVSGKIEGDIRSAFSRVDWSLNAPEYSKQTAPATPPITFEEVLMDSAGDMLMGNAPDVVRVEAELTPTRIRFRVFLAEDVDLDSAAIIVSIDTDQDPETGYSVQTGGYPPFDIGAEYDAIAVVPPLQPPGAPAFPALTVFIFDNNNLNNPPAQLVNAVYTDSNMIGFAVPLNRIGGDDGNVNIVGMSTHINSEGSGESIDVFPNIGHGSIGSDPYGDPAWLSVSPVSDTLYDGETASIEVSMVSAGLIDDTVYTAVLLVESADYNNPVAEIPVVMTLGNPPVGISDDDSNKPHTFSLMQNYPNPFNPSTVMRFDLPEAGYVRMDVYNVIGQRVKTLYDGGLPAGNHEVRWDGMTASGRPAASGIYFYRLTVEKTEGGSSLQIFKSTRKMVLMR